MIVAHFEGEYDLVVHARQADFTGIHAWRWRALQELATGALPDAWGAHHRFRFPQEVELAVLLVLQPCLHRGQGVSGAPWVLPSREHAHEVLALGKYPEPSPFFVVPPGKRITQDALQQSRDAAEGVETVDDATLLYGDGGELPLSD